MNRRHEAERLASEIDLAAMDREEKRRAYDAVAWDTRYTEPERRAQILAARTRHRDQLGQLVALVPEDEG